jgi:hypothetical protein
MTNARSVYDAKPAIEYLRLNLHLLEKGYTLTRKDAAAISTVIGYADRQFDGHNKKKG